MFKSVFTKYITAFMSIILISFTILAAIICSMVTNYTMETKDDIVEHTANTAKMYIEMEFDGSDISDFNQFVYYSSKLAGNYLTMLTNYTGDLMIFVTDTDGNILLTDNRMPNGYISSKVGSSAIAQILSGSYRQLNTLDGLFVNQHLTYALPILDSSDKVVGIVYTSSSSLQLNQLVENLLKTIIMASLWVSLAALIAVYFISEKIISPLKDMSKAAKSFAAGRFDVRVPVTGRDEVAELATAFNNMAGSLANFEDMRRTFLANVSHDLRTPMTTIAGFIDNILEGVIPPEKQNYYLGVVATEVRRLSRLVNSLLDISRIQAGDRKFNMITFDICEMARQILISFEQKIGDKNLDVEFECDSDNMYVFADRDAIYQILYNICDNGIKFSREGGKYRIGVISKDKKVFVSVYNEGIGIPEADLPFVFDRFYKSDKSRGLDKTGVGLGLYIAKTIIDAHHEEIWVKSVYGEYCEFVFTLARSHENAVKPRDEKFTKE